MAARLWWSTPIVDPDGPALISTADLRDPSKALTALFAWHTKQKGQRRDFVNAKPPPLASAFVRCFKVEGICDRHETLAGPNWRDCVTELNSFLIGWPAQPKTLPNSKCCVEFDFVIFHRFVRTLQTVTDQLLRTHGTPSLAALVPSDRLTEDFAIWTVDKEPDLTSHFALKIDRTGSFGSRWTNHPFGGAQEPEFCPTVVWTTVVERVAGNLKVRATKDQQLRIVRVIQKRRLPMAADK